MEIATNLLCNYSMCLSIYVFDENLDLDQCDFICDTCIISFIETNRTTQELVDLVDQLIEERRFFYKVTNIVVQDIREILASKGLLQSHFQLIKIKITIPRNMFAMWLSTCSQYVPNTFLQFPIRFWYVPNIFPTRFLVCSPQGSYPLVLTQFTVWSSAQSLIPLFTIVEVRTLPNSLQTHSLLLPHISF